MSAPAPPQLDTFQRWEQEYEASVTVRERVNRSGIHLKPIYTADDVKGDYEEKIGYPGQAPYTRGIYPAMYRGRQWARRMLVGLGTPEDFNRRQLDMIASGTTAINLIPCNSVFRGYDIDEVDPLLIGTCGTAVNTTEDMRIAMNGIDLGEVSLGMNDPSPFTLLAFILVLCEERGTPWRSLRGTSNQSDFISHYVANHMFYRLSLEGSRRVLVDHIKYMLRHSPKWNPLSIVGQHMQQAGATPAQTLGFTISSGLYYIDECVRAGMNPVDFVHGFTFFFDVSMSFFEEIAKFRAARRMWATLLHDRFNLSDPQSLRFKFHAQTSGADLTRQQPLNNIARVAVQGLAAILGGMQSLHTDGYDEAFCTPSAEAARIAIMTQNILAEETGATDVIDPLGGSYYVESLTDSMEAQAMEYITKIDSLGGMLEAVRCGYIQREIGRSAAQFQDEIESGETTQVGVNKYEIDESEESRPPAKRPKPEQIAAQYERLHKYKRSRSQLVVHSALDEVARASHSEELNVYEAVVGAIRAGATHGEVTGRLRTEMGFGRPLVLDEITLMR
jgi:methylmalonyl-CoA mutase N-terminal domain/subunit